MAQKDSNWLVVGDPLRGIAAFGVLIFHAAMAAALSAPHSGDLGAAGRILFNLDAGVFLFFALSGYLLGRPFASAFVLQTPLPNIPRFLVKRVRRLGPGMVAAALVGVVVWGTLGGWATIHFWTLYAEGWFYLALPLIAVVAVKSLARLSGPRQRALLWVVGTAFAAALSVLFCAGGTPADIDHQHLFPSLVFAFAPGLALAGAEPVLEPALRTRPRLGKVITRVALLGSALAFVAFFLTPRAQFVQHSVAAVTACGLILAAAVTQSWRGALPWRALDNRPLQWLGERSYSLYLFHVAVVRLVTDRLAGGIDTAGVRVAFVIAVAAPVALAAAAAGYALVERPFLGASARGRPRMPALTQARGPLT